ncbi:MAG: Ferredoxin [Methanomethylovorans sp. PtaU1.Bin093]|uniref:DUF362 domain-containing protein n=1 Tax=Methanomethylovorans sp. PtaU1.Bin093 TaxID=1811679 RepID=UPI0009D2F5D5|nr:DUF362 domain-containing protein [Methanomethylovorans sp. PtaU1.Bin093]OPY19427.1 MAG: Ferredoxin [Methanomethylovorans sp. PtaU1.Bin093]
MSKVFFRSAGEVGPTNTQIDQIKELFRKVTVVEKDDLVAIKVHPGEYGNTTYVRPVLIRTIADLVKEAGGIPFITDTTVLYSGKRFNGADMLWTAAVNGFTFGSMNAPFISADGLLGDDSVKVPIGGEYIDEITVASAIAKADAMIMISHCKGHPASGFGGAVKNLGMGCLDKEGKAKVHAPGKPDIDTESCIGCGKCIRTCPWDAIYLENGKAFVDKSMCKGELSCIGSCNFDSIMPPENCTTEIQARLGEAALGPVKLLPGKIGYINWVFDLTPGCDCFNFSAPAFAGNVGMLASMDPVAIDKASLDLINKKIGEEGCIHSIKDVWGIDPMIHLEHAAKIGVGSLGYSLDI